MNLSGSDVRTENVLVLASMFDGDELGAKLERAVANDNSIVALSLADREQIVKVLSADTPSGLADLHTVLVKQLKHRHDRDRSERRMRLDQERIWRGHEIL